MGEIARENGNHEINMNVNGKEGELPITNNNISSSSSSSSSSCCCLSVPFLQKVYITLISVCYKTVL